MSQVRQQKRTLKVGILGCGRMADNHVQAIKAATGELVAVADVNIESARRLAKRCGIQNAYGSLEEMLQAEQLDVLHIVTPPAEHYECAKAAIEHGVSVFIEKPVVFTTEQISDLYNRAVTNRVLVCPDFLLLFHPKLQKVLRLVNSGRLGRILHIDSHLRVDPAILHASEIRDGAALHWSYKLPGGVLHNYITHPLYIALYFSGKIRKITAVGRAFGGLPQELVDHLTLHIDGEKCSASVVLSFHIQPATQELRIYGESGSAYINFDWQIASVDFPGSLPRLIHRAISPYLHAAQLCWEATSSIWKFLRGKVVSIESLCILTSRFYDSIRQSCQPPISRELTVEVVRAEELIVEQAGKLHLNTQDRPSGQNNIRHPERVLVTGGSGYVGEHVVKQLVDAGYYVRAMVRPTSRLERIEPLGVELMFGDVRNIEDVRRAASGMDLVVHMAAAVTGRPETMVDIAVQGTRNITTVAAELGIKRGVYLSSMSVYDFSKLKNGDRVAENSPLEEHPELRGGYTLAKRQAEDVILPHLSEHNPSWTILRPAVIVGNRDLAIGIGKQIGRTLICFSNARKTLRLIHVEEVASAIVQILQAEKTGGQIFVLSHQPVSLREYVDTCVRAKQPGILHVFYVPYFLTWLAGIARRLMGRGSGFNRQQLSYMYRDVAADSSSLARQIGWQPKNHLLPTLVAESTSHQNQTL